jgi:hypothetical protein
MRNYFKSPEGRKYIQMRVQCQPRSNARAATFDVQKTSRVSINIQGAGFALSTFVVVGFTDLPEICTVRINGKSAGTIWAMSYRLDITNALADGRNALKRDITNLWPNRLIGDAQPLTSIPTPTSAYTTQAHPFCLPG